MDLYVIWLKSAVEACTGCGMIVLGGGQVRKFRSVDVISGLGHIPFVWARRVRVEDEREQRDSCKNTGHRRKARDGHRSKTVAVTVRAEAEPPVRVAEELAVAPRLRDAVGPAPEAVRVAGRA